MSQQFELDFTAPPPRRELPDPMPHFSGETYSPVLDRERLGHSAKLVFDVMSDGRPRTLAEIETAIHFASSQAGISARLRDFRKERFGAFTVNRRRRGDAKSGLWEYQLIVPPGVGPQQLGAPLP